MVPPFLAYYGVLTQNQSLVQAAYDQCRLYRQYLVDDDAGGMWKHIAMGSTPDNGHWTTGKLHILPSQRVKMILRVTLTRVGNGWAAGGMLRVLGTIQHSQYSKSMKNQANDLRDWVVEIHNGIYPHQVSVSNRHPRLSPT